MSALSPERRSEILRSNMNGTDCGPVALQAITGLDRNRCELLCFDHGYRPNKAGMYIKNLAEAFRSVGFECEVQWKDRGDPVSVFVAEHETGVFVISTEKHFMPLIEGELFNGDWSFHHDIWGVIEVTGEGRPSKGRGPS